MNYARPDDSLASARSAPHAGYVIRVLSTPRALLDITQIHPAPPKRHRPRRSSQKQITSDTEDPLTRQDKMTRNCVWLRYGSPHFDLVFVLGSDVFHCQRHHGTFPHCSSGSIGHMQMDVGKLLAGMQSSKDILRNHWVSGVTSTLEHQIHGRIRHETGSIETQPFLPSSHPIQTKKSLKNPSTHPKCLLICLTPYVKLNAVTSDTGLNDP